MDGTLYLVVATVGLTIVTVATRSSFFMLPARIELPSRIERGLRYAPACALTAIITQNVFAPHGHRFVSWENYQIWALLAATIVFAWKRNMILMMTVGMAVFTALRLWA